MFWENGLCQVSLSGARCVLRGGYAFYGAPAGFGYVSVGYAVGYAGPNLGGRLNASESVLFSEFGIAHHRTQGEYNVPARVSKVLARLRQWGKLKAHGKRRESSEAIVRR